jgi:hypothetical protein
LNAKNDFKILAKLAKNILTLGQMS